MFKKIIISVVTFLVIAVACLFLLDQIKFRSNQYGLAEIRIFDLSFGLTKTFDDGPYILIEEERLVVKEITAGEVSTSFLPKDAFATQYSSGPSVYKNVPKVAAISDIHGQYSIMVNILRNNNIIDENLKWNYGQGHFVIAGDIFDRGAEVLDALWLIYDLEIEAEKAGGKVHYLLGNHEYMVLQGNLKWLNGAYRQTAKLLGTEYEDLFGKDTVLGAWLRTKSTIIKINDATYVHGGISKEFLSHNYTLDHINDLYRKSIDMTPAEISNNPEYSVLHDELSPIWYRGYFDTFGNTALSDQDVTEVLSQLGVNKIIVGHTTGEKVNKLATGEVYAIDSGIKWGANGDVLFIEQSGVYRGTYDGERFKL